MRTSSASRNSEPNSAPQAPEARVQEAESPARSPSPKLEDAEEPLPQTPATNPRRSTRHLKVKQSGSPTESPASTLSGNMHSYIKNSMTRKTAGSTRTSALQRLKGLVNGEASSAAKTKRALENEEASSELPQLPATQPVSFPPAKRPRRSDARPPPASQPLPRPVATPQKASSSAAAAMPPPSTTKVNDKPKDKGKQKMVARKRSANFWHLDGSVVVQVQNTLFRLHRSRLMQQSEYFSALFSGDGRDSGGEEPDIVDSCPVYVVKGVSVLDFERLLTALDAGIAYAINPPPFPVLASLLRAAHTLKFKAVLSVATHLLRQRWPQDLSHVSSEPREHAVETILLAQQCDVPDVLKYAYYELLRMASFGQDLAVYVHAESSDDPYPLRIATEEDEKNAPPPRLAASDFVRLVRAKDALQKEWMSVACRAPLPSVLPCPLAPFANDKNAPAEKLQAAKTCADTRARDDVEWTLRLIENRLFEQGMKDAIGALQDLIEMDWSDMGYCVGCVSERRDAWSEKREKLWRRLDVLLGLKGEDEEM
ncbi:hypothetical protein L227DRAFT_547400 [Lentinus tigrinus ALCF2SS1-6]|uniref:BTB domain-containing protein n=2 Tax=Lentinus tigrinus TaxID=5365 RepID=A0A5C2S9E6_9APHY|nr:hypothetical protein L227DRAFT_547400 [Lentinus tigrinus ALCF2SS1-6]